MERQKRSAIGLLAALLISMSVNTAFAENQLNSFSDVPTSHPNYTAIMGLKSKGIINVPKQLHEGVFLINFRVNNKIYKTSRIIISNK